MNKRKFLLEEIAEWLNAGLIDSAAAQSLSLATQQKYSVDRWYKSANFMLKAVAFFIIVCGLFLILSVNWDSLPIAMRSLTFLLPLGLVHWYLWRNWQESKAGSNVEIAIFVSNLLLGLNISAQAQIFHLSRGYYPDGLLLWITGITISILVYPSLISSYLSFLLLFIYSLSKAQSYGFNYFVILFYAIPLVQTYRHAGAGGALISFTSFLAFFYSFLQYHFEPLEFVTYLMLIQLSALWYFWALETRRPNRVLRVLQNTVLVSLIFFLIIFSYEVELFFPVLDRFLLLSYAAFLIHNYMYRNGQPSLLQRLMPNGLVILFVLAFIGIHSVFELDLTVAALLTNAILISIAASFLVYAFRFQSKQAYFGGIVLLLVIVFLRYLDYFDNYFVAGILFILLGLSLLLFNNYWEKKIAVAQEKGANP